MAEEKKESTAIEKVETSQALSMQGQMTQEQKELIKRTVAKDASDDELMMFLHFCQKADVDPLRKQAHFWKDSKGTPIMMLGIDGFQKKAVQDPRYLGIASQYVCENDTFEMDSIEGTIIHKFGAKNRGRVVGAFAMLRRRDMPNAVMWVDISEYIQEKWNWRKMPGVLISKTSRSTLLRREYPDTFSGVYEPSEFGMDMNENGDLIDITPENQKPIKNSKPVKQPKPIKQCKCGNALPDCNETGLCATCMGTKFKEGAVITTENVEPPKAVQDSIDDDDKTTNADYTDEDREEPEPVEEKPKKRGRPKKEENPLIPDSIHEPQEEEPDEPKEIECGLQLSPSIIGKMKECETARQAFEVMEEYSFQGQGHHFKALVKEYCPEYFEKGYALFQIPESAVIVIVKKASGVKFKKSEDTPTCKAKGCKNKMTAPEAEQREGKCHEHFIPKEDE